jgi:N-acetylglutamate synthase-like GNAT family acetyltransferase
LQPAAPIVRRAADDDAAAIAELVNGFADEGLTLRRTRDEVLADVANYVVAVAPDGAVVACAALTEYSPSLGEVSSVAVHTAAQGQGLGSLVVAAVERLARLRDLDEVFAMSLADRFFTSLGYDRDDLARFPEKVARYDAMRAAGRTVVAKGCYRKRLTD